MTRDQNQDPDVVRSRDLPATKGMIDDLRAEMHSGFMRIEHQFKGVDHKFVGIEKRFEQVDKRFEQVDKRFEQVDKRFEQVDKRFDEVNAKFDQVNSRFDELTELIKASIAHSTQLFNEVKAISEEQRSQNLFTLDAYNVMTLRLDNQESRIKRIEDKGV